MTMEDLDNISKEIKKELAEVSNNSRPFEDKDFKRLSKLSRKKSDYVLVQYLRNNRTVEFRLAKVISGNIIVIDNKGHELNPRDTWVKGKTTWYIIREKDTKPVSVRDKPIGHSTDDHPVLVKMVLGAVAKKEQKPIDKKKIIFIIGAIILGLIIWAFTGGH